MYIHYIYIYVYIIYIYTLYIYVIYIYLYLLTFGHKNQPNLCINSYTKIHLFSCLRKPLEKAVNWGNLHASVDLTNRKNSFPGRMTLIFWGRMMFFNAPPPRMLDAAAIPLGGTINFWSWMFWEVFIFKLGTWDPSRKKWSYKWDEDSKNLLKSMRWNGIHEANWNSWDQIDNEPTNHPWKERKITDPWLCSSR